MTARQLLAEAHRRATTPIRRKFGMRLFILTALLVSVATSAPAADPHHHRPARHRPEQLCPANILKWVEWNRCVFRLPPAVPKETSK